MIIKIPTYEEAEAACDSEEKGTSLDRFVCDYELSGSADLFWRRGLQEVVNYIVKIMSEEKADLAAMERLAERLIRSNSKQKRLGWYMGRDAVAEMLESYELDLGAANRARALHPDRIYGIN